jgi:hypothetical protein
VVSVLGNYANQSLTWKHVTAISKYSEKTYTSTTIKGRKETGHKLIRDAHGKETVSSARVFTESAVTVDDLIDDKLVIAVESNILLNGSIGYYTVHLI